MPGDLLVHRTPGTHRLFKPAEGELLAGHESVVQQVLENILVGEVDPGLTEPVLLRPVVAGGGRRGAGTRGPDRLDQLQYLQVAQELPQRPVVGTGGLHQAGDRGSATVQKFTEAEISRRAELLEGGLVVVGVDNCSVPFDTLHPLPLPVSGEIDPRLVQATLLDEGTPQVTDHGLLPPPARRNIAHPASRGRRQRRPERWMPRRRLRCAVTR